MYNPNSAEASGYKQVEIDVDMDKKIIKNKGNANDTGMAFKYENGSIIIEETNSKVRFIMSK